MFLSKKAVKTSHFAAKEKVFKIVILLFCLSCLIPLKISSKVLLSNKSTYQIDQLEKKKIQSKYAVKYKNYSIRILPEDKITSKILKARKGKKELLVERIEGYVVNLNQDGITKEGNYISYRNIDGLGCLSKVYTYLVFNPKTSGVDDVIGRFDFVAKETNYRNLYGSK